MPDPRQAAAAAVDPARLAELLKLRTEGRVSGPGAKMIWRRMWDTGRGAGRIALEEDLFIQQGGAELAGLVRLVLDEHPVQVAAYQGGKKQLLGFFMAKVLEHTGAKAEPLEIRRYLKEELD